MALPYSKKEKLAGLFLLFGFFLIISTIVIVGGGKDWFRAYNEYYAIYKQGYGLAPGVKVKFLDTDIGQVTKLELLRNNKVKVHLEIYEEYASRIKGDSLAKIESPTLIGSEYIVIMQGTAESVIIPPNGQIPSQERKTLDDVLAELKLETKLQQLEATLTNITNLTHQLQDPQGPLLGTMSDVRKMTTTVAQGEGSLGQVVMKDEVYGQITTILQSLEVTSRNLAQATDALNKQVTVILSKVEVITNQVEKGTRSVPEISRGVREEVRDAGQVIDSIKKNPIIRWNLSTPEDPPAINRPVRED